MRCKTPHTMHMSFLGDERPVGGGGGHPLPALAAESSIFPHHNMVWYGMALVGEFIVLPCSAAKVNRELHGGRRGKMAPVFTGGRATQTELCVSPSPLKHWCPQ